MPVTAFSSFTDGLDPSRRSREHFITNIDLEDDRRWVPYADGVWFQPCHFNVTSGGFSVVLKGLPGAKLGTHYHVGTVRGYTMRGHWRYFEHDWVAKPGTFIYEPAGEAHTLVITEDSPEPAVIMFVVEGGLIYLDSPVNGSVAAYEDGFTALELTRESTIVRPVSMRVSWTCWCARRSSTRGSASTTATRIRRNERDPKTPASRRRLSPLLWSWVSALSFNSSSAHPGI